MYGVTIEPLHCDDPRSSERQRHDKIAKDALIESGLKPSFQSHSKAKCDEYAAKINDALEPIGRSALVSKIHYL